MSSSYLIAMPVLIYNLGVEMIYVLCSRLKAQSIAEDKSSQVIHDVVDNLFNRKFMNEMQKKQELAKHISVRQLFDKLVHSSIMRLNTTSMNKLFDLMLMSVKLQLVKTKFPEEIFQITMNHLNTLIDILQKFDAKANEDVITMVKESISYVNKTYMSMSPYDFIILRQTLLRFFQGKNVKVSIFIQDGLQSNTGVIYLPMEETAPPVVKKPGNVIKYNSSGEIVKEYELNLKLSGKYQANKNIERVNIITTELGSNIYLGERKNKEEFDPLSTGNITSFKPTQSQSNKGIIVNNEYEETSKKIYENVTSKTNNQNVNTNVNKIYTTTTSSSSYLNDNKQRKENIDMVKREFGQLADLLNVNSNRQDETQIFKFDLFKNKSNKNNSYNNEEEEDFIEIEREKDKNLDKLKGMFDDLTFNNDEKDSDDLLELMDLAANK